MARPTNSKDAVAASMKRRLNPDYYMSDPKKTSITWGDAEKNRYLRPDPNTPGVQTLTPVRSQAEASRKALNPSGRGETHPTAIARTIPGVIHNAPNVAGAGIAAFEYQLFAKR